MKKEIMITEIFSNMLLNRSFESDWIPVNLAVNGREYRAASLQLSWNGVSPLPDGTIEINVSNNQADYVLLGSYPVNSQDNRSNAKLITLNPVYEYIKVGFLKNNILTGYLNAILCYQKI